MPIGGSAGASPYRMTFSERGDICAARHSHRHSPLLEKVARNLLQEPGRTLNLVIERTAQPEGRVAKAELILGSGHCNIKETALFFHRLERFEGTRTWEHPVCEPDRKDRSPFKPFRLVNRRQSDFLAFLFRVCDPFCLAGCEER